MNVSLTPDLEQYVQNKVSSGRYQSSSEVVREALRLLEERDQERQHRLEILRAEIQEGLKGPFEPLDMDDIIAEAKADRAAKKASNNG
ncbi:MAG: type II toxin-antitoxin system ParD family antitoxin [Bacteroidota bacterium]